MASAHFRLEKSQQTFGPCAVRGFDQRCSGNNNFETRQIRETIVSRDKLFHF